MRYAFIHAIALLAVLLFCGTASADGSQVVSTSDGKTYTVIPNGQTGAIIVDHQTGKTTQVINVRPHHPPAPKGALERAKIRDQHRR